MQLFYAEGGKSPVGLRCGLRFVCALVAVEFTRAEQIVTGFQSGVSAHCAGEALAYGTDEVTGEFAWFYQPVDWRLAASNVWQHGQSAAFVAPRLATISSSGCIGRPGAAQDAILTASFHTGLDPLWRGVGALLRPQPVWVHDVLRRRPRDLGCDDQRALARQHGQIGVLVAPQLATTGSTDCI